MVAQRNRSRDFFVGRVACDWLTLTTFDYEVFKEIRTICEGYIDYNTSYSQKRLQYSGTGGDGYFFGSGEQRGERHHMIVLSGVQAAVLAPQIATSLFAPLVSCTRIDIQVTVPAMVGGRKTGELGYELRRRFKEGNGRVGRNPDVAIWDNESSVGDTIYIGSRSSDRYVRIYDKHNGPLQFLRYECEFKRRQADRIWDEFISSESALHHWLAGTISAPLREFPEFSEVIRLVEERGTADVWIEVEDRDVSRTLAWLHRQVTPAVVKLSMTDLRQEVIDWLRDLTGML